MQQCGSHLLPCTTVAVKIHVRTEAMYTCTLLSVMCKSLATRGYIFVINTSFYAMLYLFYKLTPTFRGQSLPRNILRGPQRLSPPPVPMPVCIWISTAHRIKYYGIVVWTDTRKTLCTREHIEANDYLSSVVGRYLCLCVKACISCSSRHFVTNLQCQVCPSFDTSKVKWCPFVLWNKKVQTVQTSEWKAQMMYFKFHHLQLKKTNFSSKFYCSTTTIHFIFIHINFI